MWEIFILVAIIFAFNTLREYTVYRDIKCQFICDNCDTINEEISGIHKCVKCHRTFKVRQKQWEHLMLHRVTWIDTKTSKATEAYLKDYLKIPKIEITLSLMSTLILIIGAIVIR